MSTDEPLVTVATFTTSAEAELACGYLDEEGIRSFVADGELVNTAWYMSGVVGGVKLQVAKSDFLTAERILNNRRSKARNSELDDYGLVKSTNFTARPGAIRDDYSEQRDEVSEDQDGKAEDPEDTVASSEADLTVDRATRAAVFGLVLFPPLLHLYSLWLLLQLLSMNSNVSADRRFKVSYTIVIDVLAILAALIIGQYWLLAPLYW